MIVDELIAFEENSSVLSYKYNYKEIMIWPYIRSLLFEAIANNVNEVALHRKKQSVKFQWKNYLKYNSFNVTKSDILFIKPDTIYIHENGKYVDRVVGDYINLFNNTMQLIRYTQVDLSKVEGKFVTDVVLKKLIEYEGEKNKICKEEKENIDSLIEYLKTNLPFKVEEGVYEGLRKRALKVIGEFPYYYQYYGYLMDIIKPKIVFCNCAMYGTPLIKVINDKRIITAEFQHGYIGRGHCVYNYSEKIAKNEEYREHMPKYYLSYGEYWTRDLVIPSDVYVVGNPIVARNIQKTIAAENCCKENQILIITTIQYDKYIEYIKVFLKKLPSSYKIVIKLHPLFLEDKKYFKEFFDNQRVKFMGKENIYDCIKESQYIIGDTSTALFEAGALGKTVFIIDSKRTQTLMNRDFGVWLKSGEEFVSYIQDDRELNKEKNIYFDLEWEKSYIDFLSQHNVT